MNTTSTETGKRTPADELLWIEKDLREDVVWERNPELCQQILKTILPRWQKDLPPKSWNKIRKFFVKEFNECEPCLEFIINLVKDSQPQDKFLIVDVCAGFGFASMLLSDILPPDRIPAIWLLDSAYPLRHQEPTTDQVHMDHIVDTWPIPLCLRKMNLKKFREIAQLPKYVYNQHPDTRVVFMGIHLCKALSVHAIRTFQACERAVALCLKPCCLPGKKRLFATFDGQKVPIGYQFLNGYSFNLLDLYLDKKDVGMENEDGGDEDHVEETPFAQTVLPKLRDTNEPCLSKGDNDDESFDAKHGEPRNNARFAQWLDHLRQGCLADDCRVHVQSVRIQRHHFQNQILYCQRIS